MRKNFLISGISVIGLIILILLYLSVNGIKTNKFNNLIHNKLKNFDEKLSLKTTDIFLKLKLSNNSINININNPKIYSGNKFIDLSKIDINLDLIKFIKNDNSIKNIQIDTKENSIKTLTNFINSNKFNISRFEIFNQIEGGSIQVKTNIYFDEKNQNKFTYVAKGKVKDAKLNILNETLISNINFNFKIKDQIFNFDNINLKYDNINFQSKKININKLGKTFEVKGDLKNEKSLIKINLFSKLFNFDLDFFEKKEITAESENAFSFKINTDLSIKNLNLKSKIKFDEIFTNKKYQDLIYFKDGVIKTEYNNNNLSAHILSKYSFIEDEAKNIANKKNDLNLHIVKNYKENIKVTGNLTSDKRSIHPEVLFKLAKVKSDLLSDKKISIESDNKFSFQIDEAENVKDLSINSNLKFDKLYFNKKYQDLIFLEDGIVEANFYGENFAILIDGKYSFLNEKYNNENKNIIRSKIKKEKDKDIIVETFLKNEKNKINSKELTKYFKSEQKFIKDQDIIISSENKATFEIDKNKKIKNLNVKSNLTFDSIKIDYNLKKITKRIPDYKNQIILNSDFLEIDYSKDITQIKAKGRYSFNDKFDDYEINIINEKGKYDFESSIELNNNSILINEINYKKDKESKSILKLIGNFVENNDINIEHALYSENENKISASNLKLSKDYKVKDIDQLELNYLNKNKKRNHINIIKNNNYYILFGDNFDGSSLVKSLLNGDSSNSFLKIFHNLNSEIVLNLNKFYSGYQSYLEKIEGKLNVKNNKIQSGKINALLNKENKFSLNIKTDSKNEKVTNLYIEKPAPFIKNYKFIKGFEEGSLSYDSVEKNGSSKSKLKIYDFKIKEVPILAKLLTLASLQGIADLLTGEGIRFDEFDMDYESNRGTTTIKEMYAIGPAISILMEGYIERNKLTSLRGTLVPATTINKTISKIPLLGNILVGKKVGEGVFGVSFKIKGPPKNLKTTVNPVKTLTPRFITRTVEKLKRNN